MRSRLLPLLLLLALVAAAHAAADVDDGAPAPQAAVEAPAPAPSPASPPARRTADGGARAARDAIVAVEALRSVPLEADQRGSIDTNGFVVAVDGDRGIVATDHWASAARASPAVYTLRFADGGSVQVRERGREREGGRGKERGLALIESTPDPILIALSPPPLFFFLFHQAKLLYYDPADDFAFLQFSVADRGGAPTPALALAPTTNLTAGSPLTLVGEQGDVTTRRDGFLVEPRASTNPEPRENGGFDRAARRLLTTFERAAYLAGSPVLDGEGKVVGMHSGKKMEKRGVGEGGKGEKKLIDRSIAPPTTIASLSFLPPFSGMDGAYSKAVPADKILAALDALRAGRTPPRGDLGAALRLLPAGVARRSYRLPVDAVPKPTDGGTPQVIAVASLLPGVESAGGLQPGDVVFSVDGARVGDDLQAVDRAADAKAGKSVPVVVYRNGTKLDLAKVPVRDLEAMKVKKFGKILEKKRRKRAR